MIYKEHEIYARVNGTYTDLYTLTDSGELDKSEGLILNNDDEVIVWYEFEAVKPSTGSVNIVAATTIKEAKKIIDKSIKYQEETN